MPRDRAAEQLSEFKKSQAVSGTFASFCGVWCLKKKEREIILCCLTCFCHDIVNEPVKRFFNEVVVAGVGRIKC